MVQASTRFPQLPVVQDGERWYKSVPDFPNRYRMVLYLTVQAGTGISYIVHASIYCQRYILISTKLNQTEQSLCTGPCRYTGFKVSAGTAWYWDEYQIIDFHTYQYKQVHTSTYQYILLQTCFVPKEQYTYLNILLCVFFTQWYVLVHTKTNQHIPWLI